MISGKNEVVLEGFLKFPELKETQNGHSLFQAKVMVPFSYTDRTTGEQKDSSRYVRISAWGEIGQSMGALVDGTPVRVRGHFNERSYDSNCKDCGTLQKRTWTDVQVNNFTLLDE